jgi:cytosine/adenosine deaminase-related metal-dependent hydrolase
MGPSANVSSLVPGDLHVDVVDCSDKIMMPGPVNPHIHSPLSVTNLAMTATAELPGLLFGS